MPRPAGRPDLGRLSPLNDVWHTVFRNYYATHGDIPEMSLQRIANTNQVPITNLNQPAVSLIQPNPVDLNVSNQLDYGSPSSPPPTDTAPYSTVSNDNTNWNLTTPNQTIPNPTNVPIWETGQQQGGQNIPPDENVGPDALLQMYYDAAQGSMSNATSTLVPNIRIPNPNQVQITNLNQSQGRPPLNWDPLAFGAPGTAGTHGFTGGGGFGIDPATAANMASLARHQR